MALTDSLISYWKLDEASGTATDSHGTNTLTDNNTVTSASGKINTARQWTAASSESLSHATNTDLETGNIDYTGGLWVYLDTLDSPQVFMSKYGDAGNNEYAAYYTGGGEVAGRFAFEITDGDQIPTFLEASSLGPPSAATWYYLLFWHDATADTINIQVNNGAVDSMSHTTGGAVTNGIFRLGALGDTPSLFLNGRSDEAAFWKRVLTAPERTSLYNSGSGFAYPLTEVATGFRSLLAFWVGGTGMDPDEVAPVGFHSLLGFWVGGAGTTPGEPVDIVYGTLKPIWHGRGRRR